MRHLKVFTAKWCGPCNSLKPHLKDLDITVVEIDVDEQKSLAAIHSVRGIPALKLYEDDKLLRTKTGAMTKQQLLDFVG